MEEPGVSGWVSRYSAICRMRGSKEVPPPPVSLDGGGTGESYVYHSTVDSPKVCVKKLTQYGFRSSTRSSPLKLSTERYILV
jgi:hypothetical protein